MTLPDRPPLAAMSDLAAPRDQISDGDFADLNQAIQDARHNPSENCYCGGPEEIYPHRLGTGHYCKRETE